MLGTNMGVHAFTKMTEFLANRWGQRNQYPMATRFELQVHFAYDDEADVWYVAKSDIPGLSLEAGSPSELLDRVAKAAPELIELNSGMLAKVVDVRPTEPKVHRSRRNARKGEPARPWSVRPVFDAPLDLCHA